ncbi:13525_t:CDS:2, partial [Funneliformis caledonium]
LRRYFWYKKLRTRFCLHPKYLKSTSANRSIKRTSEIRQVLLSFVLD